MKYNWIYLFTILEMIWSFDQWDIGILIVIVAKDIKQWRDFDVNMEWIKG